MKSGRRVVKRKRREKGSIKKNQSPPGERFLSRNNGHLDVKSNGGPPPAGAGPRRCWCGHLLENHQRGGYCLIGGPRCHRTAHSISTNGNGRA